VPKGKVSKKFVEEKKEKKNYKIIFEIKLLLISELTQRESFCAF